MSESNASLRITVPTTRLLAHRVDEVVQLLDMNVRSWTEENGIVRFDDKCD